MSNNTNKTKAPTGTQEWAASNVNIQAGCEHACRYCYASSMAIRFKRATPESWAEPVVDPAKVAKGYARRDGRIMFPTSHDITPANIDACAAALGRMLTAGNDVLVVSKPHRECVELLCRELAPYKRQVTFRFTIGSADDSALRFWEPGAPAFEERLACLRHACEAGFETSVSCEPMLDGDPGAVVEACRPYVTDAVWIGRANGLMARVAKNCPGDDEVRDRARALLALHSDEWILALHGRYGNDPLIKWKDSIKKVAGLERPEEKGLDV